MRASTRFALLALRQYVEKHRRTEPMLAALAEALDLAELEEREMLAAHLELLLVGRQCGILGAELVQRFGIVAETQLVVVQDIGVAREFLRQLAVDRDDVRKGAEELGIPLEEHVQFCIAALRENADALGLRGTL
jgi:hypothetical protein